METAQASNQLIMDRLRTVRDPELGIDIVSLGLIYKAEWQADSILVVMTLTTPGCPLGHVIHAQIRDSLFDLVSDPDEQIQIQLTFDPPWIPDMMSEEARLELGL